MNCHGVRASQKKSEQSPDRPLCLPTCAVGANISYVDYSCPPIGGISPPPLLGTALGRLTVVGATPPFVGSQNSDAAEFSWMRLGFVTVVVFGGPGPTRGGGVAAFVPMPPLPTCAAPGPLTAHIVGLALVEQGI